MINPSRLVQAEFISRLLMSLILLSAGISKFFSAGGFKGYYSGLFQNADLRINIPAAIIDPYLTFIPFIEVGLGLLLLVPAFKPYTVYAWFGFMASLLVGHYILQEFSAVNQMLAYFFLGLISLILPTSKEI